MEDEDSFEEIVDFDDEFPAGNLDDEYPDEEDSEEEGSDIDLQIC